MAWPLTGRALADFNRMLNDWKQYSTFPFIGTDDIERLYNVLLAAGLKPQLEDVGNRPQYWLLQLVSNVSGSELSGSGSPVGSAIPQFVGQLYHDTDADAYWRSTGLTSADWVAIGGAASRITTTPVGLELAQFIYVYFVPGVTSITLEAADYGVALDIESQDDLISFNAPNLVNIFASKPFGLSQNVALASIFLGNAIIENGSTLTLSSNALSQASVDHILARCVASAGFVSGTVDLSGGTNSPPSSVAPGSDYDILVNRGVTVNVN